MSGSGTKLICFCSLCESGFCETDPTAPTGGRCYFSRRLTAIGTWSSEQGCGQASICAYYKSLNGNDSYCCEDDRCNFGINTTDTSTIVSSTATNFSLVSAATPTIVAALPANMHIGIIIVICIFVLALIVIVPSIIYWRMMKGHRSVHDDTSFPLENGLSKLSITQSQVPLAKTDHLNLRERSMAMDIVLGQKIGEGSFGRVHVGTYKSDPVAVKIFGYRFRESFLKENSIYKAIMTSTHDNILGYKGCDMLGNELWLVTEYCELGSLKGYLDRQSVDSVCDFVHMAKDIAAGLYSLHHDIKMFDGAKLAVAHRDFKSSNIFLRRNVNGGVTCVIGDFGYSVTNNDSFSRNSSFCRANENKEDLEALTNHLLVGTIVYMSPEVLDGRIDRYDFEKMKASDVYSLGLVLWEIGMRTKVAGVEPGEHVLPYSEWVAQPNIAQMRDLVCVQNRRPTIPPWWDESESMKVVKSVMEQCWLTEPNNRVSACYAKSRFEPLVEMYNRNRLPSRASFVDETAPTLVTQSI